MPKLSIISHFYNYPQKVEEQIEHWKKIQPELVPFLEFILVDDCSQDRPCIDPGELNLRYFRVITDIQWNQAGARNLGAFHASGDWGLFFDIDQRLKLETISSLLVNLDRLDPMVMYSLRIKELVNILNNDQLLSHPNTFLVNMKKFKTYGMYDEDFAGYYGYEDLYLPKVWEKAGGTRILLNDPVFFEDVGFGTSSLNRSLERNLALASNKLNSGCKNSPGILRFEWEEIPMNKNIS